MQSLKRTFTPFLLRIEDILDTLGRSRFFSTLDLSSGFWQIPGKFTTHCGLFEFNRMPFGLCNAPSTFQRLMQTVLAGIDGKSCFLVCSRTFEEVVFERLRAANLKLKVGKCVFLQEQVKYLGHTISRLLLQMCPKSRRFSTFRYQLMFSRFDSFWG